MFTVSLITFLALLATVTGRNPVRYLGQASQVVVRNPKLLWILGAIGMVLAINALQLKLEGLLSSHIGWDLTDQVAQVGLDLLIGLQRLEWLPLTQLLTFVYVTLWPLLGVAALIVFCSESDVDSLKRLMGGLVTNYLVALPFYILLPVKEAWAAEKGVRFLIPDVYPLFEAQYRPLTSSGSKICWPAGALATRWLLSLTDSRGRSMSWS